MYHWQKKYNVGTSTITGIKAKKDELEKLGLKLDSEDGLKNRKTLRTANRSALADTYGLRKEEVWASLFPALCSVKRPSS